MQAHDIMPEFLQVISTFCEKVSDVEETYCVPLCSRATADTLESCYAVKYAEYNGREDLDPWSIRQSAMYHQYDRLTDKSVYILISPYAQSAAEGRCVGLMQEAESHGSCAELHLGLHKVLLEDCLVNWREYLGFYEQRIEDLTAEVLGPDPAETLSAHAGHLAEFRFLESRILPLDTIFTATLRTLSSLKTLQTDFQARAQPTTASTALTHQDVLPAIGGEVQHVESFQAHAEGIRIKCLSAVQLVDRALNLRYQSIAQEQTALMTQLTESTVDDSATVRVITIITLIYLSFTVVGTVMGMPFFYLDQTSKGLVLSPQFWIYVAVALPMTLGSIAYWRWMLSEKRKRQLQRRALHEKVAMV